MSQVNEAAEVTTTQFLTAIFRGKAPQDRVFFNNSPTMSPADPRAGGSFWGGRHSDDVAVFGNFHSGNTYYCVSSVGPDEDGKVRRSEDHFRALHVLVLDDIKSLSDLPTDPSYVLETSEGNYQVGFIFSNPVAHLPTARAFMRGMTRSGWLKGNVDASGNNPVRWVRAPGGRNWKTNPPFMHRIVVWLPELVFDPVDLAAQLGIDLTPEAEAPAPAELAGPVGASIPEGARNSTMTSLAGTMRRRGFGEDAIYEALRVENHARCSPPLPEKDIRTIARSIARYAPSESYLAGEYTEQPEPTAFDIKLIDDAELSAARMSPRVIVADTIFADVRTRYAAGGTGKTTLALFEAVTAALKRRLWGKEPEKYVRTLFITKEDDREILVARMRKIMAEMSLTDEERRHVLDHVCIVDAVGMRARLSKIAGDMVVPDRETIDRMIEGFSKFRPDWLIFDPLVSFGVGEARVNDAEQGIIESARIIRRALDCCVEAIHHISKAAGADKRDDQYVGRGGSALSDGARMVVSMRLLDSQEFMTDTQTQLLDGQSGIKMALPKISYAAPQQPIYIRRDGYCFEMVEAKPQTEADKVQSDNERLLEFLKTEAGAGKFYTFDKLEASTSLVGLSRSRLRDAKRRLVADGLIKVPERGGAHNQHIEVLSSADWSVKDEDF